MTFQSLLVSKDEQATAVLTPVLSGFGLSVQCCGYPDGICRLTEQKFDAVIVDYDDPDSAALVLQNAYHASSGHNTLTVALLSDNTKVRNVFGAGANFVLYKPISEQQAQASLRAATALLKRERRRSFRVPVQLPVQLRVMQNGAQMEGILLNLSEDGLDVLAEQPLCPSATIAVPFSLPDPNTELEVRGEVAWANPNGESGVRFVDLPENLRTRLRAWVAANAPELPEDPEPVSQCKLSDLSLGGCYVETESPFPERSGVVLCLKAADMEVQAEGMVRVMHPGVGMGIEFASCTAEERERVANFIGFLTSRPGTQPDLLITPGALTARNGYHYPEMSGAEEAAEDVEDPLLELLRRHESLSQEEFLQELRKQRNSEEVASS
jgi:CheY-like chemotaxis protein